MLHHFLNWNGSQAFIVHFPIVLLLTAPLLIVVGIGLSPEKRRPFLWSALAIMALGTAATVLDLAAGETAMKAIASSPRFEVALDEYRSLAETTTGLFCLLTLGFAALLFAPRRLGLELDSRVNTALLAAFLVFYATGALFLVHTALQGGQLVRELGATTAATYQLSGKESVR
jgi:uncharacterized membrane protein